MKDKKIGVIVLVIVLLVLGGYGIWLETQPEAFLSEVSKESGLVLTARATSVGVPYILHYEDLTVRPKNHSSPSSQGAGAGQVSSLRFEHLSLSALGLHSARITFRDLSLRSSNPLANMLLSAVGVRKGEIVVREVPGKIILPHVEASDNSLTLVGKGEVDRLSSGDVSRFDFTFDLEARGELAQFLGAGRQPGHLYGEKGQAHLFLGGRQVF
ncbi:MAG: hypothetical protein ACP5OP_06720 [Leptospirillia bacterium]